MSEIGIEKPPVSFFTSIRELVSKLGLPKPKVLNPSPESVNWSEYNSWPKSPVENRARKKKLGTKDLTGAISSR